MHTYTHTRTHTHTYTHTYIYIYIYISSKHHLEKRAIDEHFSLLQTATTSSITRKTNSSFCQNCCAGKAHTKVRGAPQI